jgi:hypothetical protein
LGVSSRSATETNKKYPYWHHAEAIGVLYAKVDALSWYAVLRKTSARQVLLNKYANACCDLLYQRQFFSKKAKKQLARRLLAIRRKHSANFLLYLCAGWGKRPFPSTRMRREGQMDSKKIFLPYKKHPAPATAPVFWGYIGVP